MATADASDPASTRSQHAFGRTSTGQQVVAGVGALTITKGADVLTTIGGLQFESTLHESNPLAAAAIQQVGVLPALLGLGLATILVIALLTEFGVTVLQQRPETTAADTVRVRLLGYGLASTLNLSVAAHNAFLVLTV